MLLDKSKVEAKINTSIKISPKKNQLIVVLCLLGFVLFSAVGCFFSWNGKDYVPPFIVAGLLGAMSAASFLLTYKSGDLNDKEPFEIVHSQEGINVKMDHALFTRQSDFANVVSLMAHTRKLPKPAGMIDESGNVIGGSEAHAKVIADQANDSIEGIIKENLDAIKKGGMRLSKKEFLQEGDPKHKYNKNIGSNVIID